jgi:hypothetical protein
MINQYTVKRRAKRGEKLFLLLPIEDIEDVITNKKIQKNHRKIINKLGLKVIESYKIKKEDIDREAYLRLSQLSEKVGFRGLTSAESTRFRYDLLLKNNRGYDDIVFEHAQIHFLARLMVDKDPLLDY